MQEVETVVVETTTPQSTRATARHHVFVVDKLPAAGGQDRGPMASEYFLASLASCQITTAHRIAIKRRQQIDRITIAGTLFLDDGLIERVHLDIQVRGGCNESEMDTIFRLAERSCTISRAVNVPIERRIRLVT